MEIRQLVMVEHQVHKILDTHLEKVKIVSKEFVMVEEPAGMEEAMELITLVVVQVTSEILT